MGRGTQDLISLVRRTLTVVLELDGRTRRPVAPFRDQDPAEAAAKARH